jgi:hypothetical protein
VSGSTEPKEDTAMKRTITTVLLGVFAALSAGAAFGSAVNNSRSNSYKTFTLEGGR